MRSAVICVLVVLLCNPFALGSLVRDISTGFDNQGDTVIGDGLPDPDYVITPGDLTSTVVDGYPPPWVANTATSKWVGFDTTDSLASPGNYDFTTTVFLDSALFISSTAVISGAWSTDNLGLDIVINGTSTGITNDGNFHVLHPLTDVGLGLFQEGVNTIIFRFSNSGDLPSPSGLRVDAGVHATVNVTPEPATLGLLSIGVVLVGWFRRRRAF